MDGDEDEFTVIPLPASPRISLGKRNHTIAAHATVLVALLRRMPFILLYQVDDDGDVFHMSSSKCFSINFSDLDRHT